MNILSNEISRMYEVDQSARRDLSSLPANKFMKFKYVVYSIDEVHNLQLKSLVEKYGFPTLETVSADILAKLHVLVLHQDEHPEFQKECAEKCGFSKTDKNQILERTLAYKHASS